MSSYDVKAKAEYINLGLTLSILLHALLVIQIFSKTSFSKDKLPPKVIYSVSVEGGKNLGGIAQLPDPKNKADIAPPKKVAEKKAPPPVTKKEEVVIPKKEEKKPEVKPEVKPEPKKEEVPVIKKEEPKIIEPKKEEVKKAEPVKKEEIKKAEPTKTEEVKKTADSKQETKTPPKKETTKEENYEDALQKYLGESTNAGGQGFGSAGTGKNGLGGGVVKSPAWFKYKEELETQIKKGWNWHDSASPLIAAVSFKISQTGEISDVRIVQSSGDGKFDDSALRAVTKASPVPAALPEIYEDFKEVILDFEPGKY